MRSASVTVSKNFERWITVYYPEKKETIVTLWYIEKTTDKTGKVDSTYFTDDVLLKDGKILRYDEKQRFFPDKMGK